MKFPLYIALRYLFSPKKHNAINIISLICAIGVCIGTMALVCVLSVFNGFQDLIGGTFSQLDPDLRISKIEGKTFDRTAAEIQQVTQQSFVETSSFVMEENAVVKYGERQTWLTVKGVDENYKKLIDTNGFIKDGRFIFSNGENEFGLLGLTLAAKLDASIYVPQPLELYAPKHNTKIEMSNPEGAFNQESIYLSGIYSADQEEIDGKYLYVSIKEAQHLFDYGANDCTGLELKLKSGTNVDDAKKVLTEKLGPNYKVEDKKEQHLEFYRMLKVEKWISYLILTFILLIAVFNVTGSLSMLIIEKKDDINTLHNLGANNSTIANIFLLEGWLVTILGAIVGVLIGVGLCLAQQQWGLISLGGADESGMFLTDAYPVDVQIGDLFIVLFTVLLSGLLVAWLPTRILRSKN